MCSSTPPMDGRKKSLSISTHSLRRVPLAMSSSSSRTTRGDDDSSGSGLFARVERRARDDIARAMESEERLSVKTIVCLRGGRKAECERMVRYGFYDESSKILKNFECEEECLSSRRA